MKLICPKCHKWVEVPDEELAPVPKGALYATETCPDCDEPGGFSDLDFETEENFNKELREILEL